MRDEVYYEKKQICFYFFNDLNSAVIGKHYSDHHLFFD